MLIMKDQLIEFKEQGILAPGNGWGDAEETACLMSALTGRTDTEGCVAEGWPEWLAELGTVIFDNAGDQWWERSVAFTDAVQDAESRGADFDAVFCAVRMNAVLPIAMESIGSGSEPWRVRCRNVVHVAMEKGGAPLSESEKVEAARAARAARAAEAAGAAEAEAHTDIFNATIDALKAQ